MSARTIHSIKTQDRGHWVGDGFPVRSLFSYQDDAKLLSPFLMLDYAGPYDFAPTNQRRGVGAHPHRGFETVTVVYSGEVEHRDSSGGGGGIGPGDVQWMTAAAGIVHEEFHGRNFAKNGGVFELLQLWVNLPAKDKSAKPGYQSILREDIPNVNLPGGGHVRVIAGDFNGTRGPAHTFTPINVWDLNLKAGQKQTLAVPADHNVLLAVLRGTLTVDGQAAGDGSLVVFEQGGDSIELTPGADAKALLLTGQPILEPIAAYGPFVMNTQAEIRQAISDYESGKMGRLA